MLRAADFEAASLAVRASVLRPSASIAPPVAPLSWSEIGGMCEVKQRIQRAVEWPTKRAEAYKRLGVRAPRGVLLHGPPGCAKTSLARAAAGACAAQAAPVVLSSRCPAFCAGLSIPFSSVTSGNCAMRLIAASDHGPLEFCVCKKTGSVSHENVGRLGSPLAPRDAVSSAAATTIQQHALSPRWIFLTFFLNTAV